MLKFYVAATQMFRKYLVDDERGVTAIEYGLIAGLVAVLLIGALTLTGNSLNTIFNAIATEVQGAAARIPGS